MSIIISKRSFHSGCFSSRSNKFCLPTCLSLFSRCSSMGSPNGQTCPCLFIEIYDICPAQRIYRFFSVACSPSADRRNRLREALQQCEMVLAACQEAHPI